MTDAPLYASRRIAEMASIRAEIATLTADEEVIRDTLEGEVDLDGVLDFLLAGIAHDEQMINAIEANIENLQKRAERLWNRVATQKTLITKALNVCDQIARERPTATVSLNRKAPSLGDLDASKIPAKYWLEGEPKLDRRSILDALKNKEVVPGAALAPETKVLSIRRT